MSIVLYNSRDDRAMHIGHDCMNQSPIEYNV